MFTFLSTSGSSFLITLRVRHARAEDRDGRASLRWLHASAPRGGGKHALLLACSQRAGPGEVGSGRLSPAEIDEHHIIFACEHVAADRLHVTTPKLFLVGVPSGLEAANEAENPDHPDQSPDFEFLIGAEPCAAERARLVLAYPVPAAHP
jgi:hypothetical protein